MVRSVVGVVMLARTVRALHKEKGTYVMYII